ncbi:D-ribose pyranase [Sedimentibacter sp. MB31-C6]|uniref:D-ribose pyranase n=1 Tax=Sedimentibacter sp. MB31-C6 TaxID=3109366 RepID=UPI002DDCC443|nr:D-ribose pyranase [Sedimentibacter sp. MB36-C1]WSI03481.1 D-ribose pyranase [Sedimentibacter sp. MB36-C1]
MKKGKLLNSEISYVISKMGHTDSLTIGDCGLPIPDGVQRIDLAVIKGIPKFIPVLQAILEEQLVEKVILAEEIKENNSELNKEIIEILKQEERKSDRLINVEYIPHEYLKQETAKSKAVIRTGEYKPYANIILVSGVTFN